jgi:RES domain-containing protein
MPYAGTAYRATGMSVEPTAASISGGRWSPSPDRDVGVPALYTSLLRDGALAELSSFLASLTPIPKARLIKVTALDVVALHAVRLGRDELTLLGVDMTRYGHRDYGRTQQIGAAMAFLGVDGLLAPSARWDCENFILFQDNHDTINNITVRGDEAINWRAWAKANGIVAENS